MYKLLILFAYYEGSRKEEVHTNYQFFIKNGYYDDENIFYIFVINGKCTIPLMVGNNIKIINRDNIGFDFGAYSYVLSLIPNLYNSFDYYFFINSSVRGPFLLPINKNIRWYEPFINLFNNDTKLVGCTIGVYYPYIYVESYAFMLNNESLNFLKNKIFNKIFTKFEDCYEQQEFKMTEYILLNNWNISGIIPEQQEIDYRNILHDKKYNKYKINNSQLINEGGVCNGRDIHPYEVIFVKTNRPLNKNTINSLTIYNLENLVISPYNYNNPYEVL